MDTRTAKFYILEQEILKESIQSSTNGQFYLAFLAKQFFKFF